jgi:hypothetical protein
MTLSESQVDQLTAFFKTQFIAFKDAKRLGSRRSGNFLRAECVIPSEGVSSCVSSLP